MRSKYFRGIFHNFRLYLAMTEIDASTIQVQAYQYQHPNSIAIPQPPFTCELKIYETAGDKGWNCIRRAILTGTANSSSADLRMWCHSYCRLPNLTQLTLLTPEVMPLSRVQLKNDECRHVTVKWSDCRHRKNIESDRSETGFERFPPDMQYVCCMRMITTRVKRLTEMLLGVQPGHAQYTS
jgi:hypothetical protein